MVICIGLVQAPARAFPRPARNDGRSGPVHTMSTSANGWHGAPIEAPDFGKIGSKDRVSLRGKQRRVARQGTRSLRVAAKRANALCCKASPGGLPAFVSRLAHGSFGRATHLWT